MTQRVPGTKVKEKTGLPSGPLRPWLKTLSDSRGRVWGRGGGQVAGCRDGDRVGCKSAAGGLDSSECVCGGVSNFTFCWKSPEALGRLSQLLCADTPVLAPLQSFQPGLHLSCPPPPSGLRLGPITFQSRGKFRLKGPALGSPWPFLRVWSCTSHIHLCPM